MRLVSTPYYKDIFDEEVPNLKDLIVDIPTKFIVSYYSYFNSKLYLDSSLENQIGILNEMLESQSIETKDQIKKNIKNFVCRNKSNREIGLISKLHILSLVHFSLCNYFDCEIIEISTTQELNLFKAYMVIVNQKSKKSTETYLRERNSDEKESFFPRHTWPILFDQMEATPHYDHISDLIRAMCLFNFFEFNSGYSEYVKKFIRDNGHNNTWEYVISIMNVMSQRWDNEGNINRVHFSFNCDDRTKPLYESLCLNPKTYGLNYKDSIENHSLMKSNPLFKYENSYVVLDWNYFSNKLYDGLIFDFFNRSGIKENIEVNSIPKFKKFIGKNITEGFTFQKLLTGILKKKHSVLRFPRNDSKGEADGYYREGNKIILFEIKDAFFAGSVLTSNSYRQIKSEIDKKYNNPKKGTGQLLKQIQKMTENSFEVDTYKELGRKPRNFIIYPVIIYTDIHFGLPGVSNYLIKEFEDQVFSLGLRKSFRRIENVTFLSLSFFIQYYTYIQANGFFKVMDMLHQELNKRRKKHDFKREIEYMFKLNAPPEQIIQEAINCADNAKMDFRDLAQVLELTVGLPENFVE
jgi:hypothetical protein